MATQTQSPFHQHLAYYQRTQTIHDKLVNIWVIQVDGAMNQRDREKALERTIESISLLPENDLQKLVTRLATIKFELNNPQAYEDELRLKLTAYAIIKHVREKWKSDGTLAIIALRCQELTRICEDCTIE